MTLPLKVIRGQRGEWAPAGLDRAAGVQASSLAGPTPAPRLHVTGILGEDDDSCQRFWNVPGQDGWSLPLRLEAGGSAADERGVLADAADHFPHGGEVHRLDQV